MVVHQFPSANLQVSPVSISDLIAKQIDGLPQPQQAMLKGEVAQALSCDGSFCFFGLDPKLVDALGLYVVKLGSKVGALQQVANRIVQLNTYIDRLVEDSSGRMLRTAAADIKQLIANRVVEFYNRTAVIILGHFASLSGVAYVDHNRTHAASEIGSSINLAQFIKGSSPFDMYLAVGGDLKQAHLASRGCYTDILKPLATQLNDLFLQAEEGVLEVLNAVTIAEGISDAILLAEQGPLSSGIMRGLGFSLQNQSLTIPAKYTAKILNVEDLGSAPRVLVNGYDSSSSTMALELAPNSIVSLQEVGSHGLPIIFCVRTAQSLDAEARGILSRAWRL